MTSEDARQSRDPACARSTGTPPSSALSPVTVRWRKWLGDPHWVHECVWLGSDEHGDWLGQRRGAVSSRPGRHMVADTAQVALVSRSGEWVATFYAPGRADEMEVYIDLGHQVEWAGSEPAVLTGIDMDLDVIRTGLRGTWVDDEDEFSVHSGRWTYPDALRTNLPRLAERLRRTVAAGAPPFDAATPGSWLQRLTVDEA